MNEIEHKIAKLIQEGKDVFEKMVTEYTYSQIGMTFLEMSEKGLIRYEEEKYIVTEKGKEEYYLYNDYEKIDILKEEKLDKKQCLTIDDIYIPNYSKGGFGEIKN